MNRAPERQTIVFNVQRTCEFVRVILPAGAVVVVRPGHPTRPITVHKDLPEEFGDLAELVHEGSLQLLDT